MQFSFILFYLGLFRVTQSLPTPFDPLPTSRNCTGKHIKQDEDHFTYPSNSQFNQRYFVCDQFFTRGGPIFFYTGNEADITLFVNNTGFMWELGKSMGAFLVFAEHRGYGESITSIRGANQVLSDYAHLIVNLFTTAEFHLPQSTPVITFGSSYGGMLSGWMRIKYPHLVEGALASSAPIFHMFGVNPSPDGTAFASKVTQVAGTLCASRLRRSLQVIENMTRYDARKIRKILNLCETPTKDEMTMWANQPWGFLAMGNYPFPNNYIPITAGVGSNSLPVYPLTYACAALTRSMDSSDEGLLESFKDSVQIWYNNTETQRCFHVKKERLGDQLFMSLRCSDIGGPYSQGTSKDAFAPRYSIDQNELDNMCTDNFGYPARLQQGAIEFGMSKRDTVAAMTNIIWSNGELDPWADYGVACGEDGVRCHPSVVSPRIAEGAHSQDLLFSHPLDSDELTNVRRLESAHISSWIEAKLLRYAGVEPQNPFPMGELPNVILSQ